MMIKISIIFFLSPRLFSPPPSLPRPTVLEKILKYYHLQHFKNVYTGNIIQKIKMETQTMQWILMQYNIQ